MMEKTNCKTKPFTTYRETVTGILDELGAAKVLAPQPKILIKPNLINADPFPVTTPPDMCEAVIGYIQKVSKAKIIIGEGCGDAELETNEVFHHLGYDRLAEKHNIELIDLNHADLVRVENPELTIFPHIFLPEIAFSSFIISVPVLKAHSMCEITGSLKNMMGFAPPKHYSGQYGTWKKAFFHSRLHEAVIELNRYKTPDLTVMDATIGLSQFHLGGPTCKPPVNTIIAGFDPKETDRQAALCLGIDWRTVPHLV